MRTSSVEGCAPSWLGELAAPWRGGEERRRRRRRRCGGCGRTRRRGCPGRRRASRRSALGGSLAALGGAIGATLAVARLLAALALAPRPRRPRGLGQLLQRLGVGLGDEVELADLGALADNDRLFGIDLGRDAARKPQVADPDGVADGELGDVDLDVGRDVRRAGVDGQR